MTSNSATPILSRNPFFPDQAGSGRIPVPTAGKFASLIHQAVLKPQPRARGATGRTPRDANPAVKGRNQNLEEALKTSEPEKEKDSGVPLISSWSTGFVAPVSLQPAAVPDPVVGHSGSGQPPVATADAGFLIMPALSAGEIENGSTSIANPEASRAPNQAGRSDAGFDFTRAPFAPNVLTSPTSLKHEKGTGQSEDTGPWIAKHEPPGTTDQADMSDVGFAFTSSRFTSIPSTSPLPGGDQGGTESNEDASPWIANPTASGAPARAGRLDFGFAPKPARLAPMNLTGPSPIRCENGIEQKEDGSSCIQRPEAGRVAPEGVGNACKEEPAKTDLHRQVAAAVATEPGPRAAESVPESDLPEQLSLASAPQPVLSDQPTSPWQVAAFEPAPNATPSALGMSPALHRNTMQTEPKVDENCCLAEQNLPALKAADSPQAAQKDRTSSVTIADHIAIVPANAAEAALIAANRPVGHDFLVHTQISSAQPTLGQAVGHAIENTVVGLQHTNATSLAVVLKPDGNTQLSLHLKMQHGNFEAIAVLERGDFKSLTSEWAQLQSRLSDHGIRLAPLVSNLSRTAGFASGQFSSPKQQRDDTPSSDTPGPDMASLPARKSGAPILRSTTGREWWA